MQKPDTRTLYTPEEYKQKIKAAGPLDFALHGIGRNGHIGFNEPNSAVDSETRNVILAETTSIDNFPNSSNSERSIAGMTLGLKELQAVAHTLYQLAPRPVLPRLLFPGLTRDPQTQETPDHVGGQRECVTMLVLAVHKNTLRLCVFLRPLQSNESGFFF